MSYSRMQAVNILRLVFPGYECIPDPDDEYQILFGNDDSWVPLLSPSRKADFALREALSDSSLTIILIDAKRLCFQIEFVRKTKQIYYPAASQTGYSLYTLGLWDDEEEYNLWHTPYTIQEP